MTTVTTIANISAFLAKLNWNGAILSENGWTITMIIIATFLNLMVLYTRNMYEFAIYIRHQKEYKNIANTAIIIQLLLLL
ncbi:hypothetical protein GH721_09540 [Kriegella sp. EG-1]|nr:hypothetical protein [Flavobacteriaceae bacterium EG-1]